MIKIASIDHVVLSVASIDRTCDFYQRALGMRVEQFGGGRVALNFGNQKFNLHEAGKEFEPKAHTPLPGSADFCLIADTPLDEVVAHRSDRADALSLTAVFVVAILAAIVQLVLYTRLSRWERN